ncbi:MAG: TonB-dependent receptor [Bacteroidetes bacterium]|nr:TonB-dependent receptor [Bacteroidota bacterium]
MRRSNHLFFLVLIFFTNLAAQGKFTISGYVRDIETGEELLGATVTIVQSKIGMVTNEYGFYSLALSQGTYTVRYSYIGFQPFEKQIQLEKSIRLNVELTSDSEELDEVVVTGKREDNNIKSTELSVVGLNMKEVKFIPVLLGEQDVLKTIQLMPGVSQASEGSTGFFVRGGDADQNLILLDEAPVFNVSHLLGFFSVFNSDALKDVKLYKGGIPVQYGGRSSSVLDIRMKNGSTKEWNTSGGIGLISSRLTVEGPISIDKGSMIVSGRRTYADLAVKAVTSNFEDLSLYFYDLNIKANYNVGDHDRLYLSGYFGRDVFDFSSIGVDWGNKTGTLRWNHIFNEQLFSNTALIYSDYTYGFKVDNEGNLISLSTGIFDYEIKNSYNWFVNPDNTIAFGWDVTYYKFRPGNFSLENSESNSSQNIAEQKGVESGLYASSEQKLDERLTILYGFRLSSFSNVGAYTVKSYDEKDKVVGSTMYDDGDFYHTYFGWEPRIHATYLLDEKSSAKISFNRLFQYLHLLSNSTSSSTTDLWSPSSPLVKPEITDQIALGYFRNFDENAWEFSVEGYYKNLANQVDYEDGADSFLNPDVEAELVFGKGRAYGVELFLRKNDGELSGWISYTLSKSERRYDAINNGKWFSARQDRAHNISLVTTYRWSSAVMLSAEWLYYTGDAVTYPVGKYAIDGAIVNLYSSRNADRMPDYHRLDIGLIWTLSDKPGWHSDINFSVYNVYNRKNAYTITFQESENHPGTTEAVRLSLFGIIPSVSWNFHF